ncbi:MAG: Fic family protein [Bdellovibrionota bacterium]
MERPPYQITTFILNKIAEIQELLGEIKTFSIKKPSIKLRKENKIKTIHHSLAIEGNSLTEEQITALLENKRILGPKKQILEVENAIRTYDKLATLDPSNERDFLKAHKILMDGLVEKPGVYRHSAVGIFKGSQVTRMAPSEKIVPRLMSNLFNFIKEDKETHELLKACLFHYELEFIHPFLDGNGRMGRLWQQRILMKLSPSFEYLPVETLIHKNQKKYYKALETSDKNGDSTVFLEFSLEMILLSLKEFMNKISFNKLKAVDRIDYALEHFGENKFSRKEYRQLYMGLSTASASRDLALAVSEKKLKIFGTKALAVYKRI